MNINKTRLLPVVGFILLAVIAGCAGNTPEQGAGSNAQLLRSATPLPSQVYRDRETLTPTEQVAAGKVITGVSRAKKTKTPTPTDIPVTPATPGGPTPTSPWPKFADNVDPLTGLKVKNPDLLDRRPVLVKVSNYPRYGRPHAGLSYADIVFEYYIGEEENRFLAVYYGQDVSKVGPVRSGRLVDGPLTNMYGGILGYGNADPQVDDVIIKQLGERALPFKNAPCPAICGLDTHSIAGVFANTAELSKLATKNGVDNGRQDLTGTLFDANPPDGGKKATFLGVEYSPNDRGEWRYDAKSGKYLRWIETAIDSKNTIAMRPLTDRLTGKQLAFSNVIIIYAIYVEHAPTLLDTMITQNIHGQRAIFFRDGQMIEGKWRTAYDNRPLQFLDKKGNPMPLKPGNTWIVIAGNSSSFDQSSSGKWELQFELP
jgi:hypothetical protein